METKIGNQEKNVFVVVNPVAGHAKADEILKLLEERFGSAGWVYNVFETTGKENVAEIARNACAGGAGLVIAAGGDGTVAGVVNGLMHTGVPLGILPVGTGNGLARALSIPLTVTEALDLITGPHDIQTIDALQVQDQYFVLNVSVGITARSIKLTGYEQKQRFGIAAYVWTFLNEFIGLEPRRFNLLVDDHQLQVRAAEILVTNGAILQASPVDLFGSAESLTDGQVEVHLLLARSLTGYLRLLWQIIRQPQGRKEELRKLTVREMIKIDTVQRPQPVQADGELIGKTPVEIRVVPQALQVLVPKREKKEEGGPGESSTS
jgi:YegS/Rv2252/BmrU family lipid kinase